MHSSEFIIPDWPAPACVRAAVTTRRGGSSRGPYESFNLGDQVGDDPEAVRRNRARLRERLRLSSDPVWLKQVHGTAVVDGAIAVPGTTADGAWCDRPGVVLGVLTADCLPVLLCDRSGTRVAALHAGWRGLAAGVIERGVEALGGDGAGLLAWLGPAIGPQTYEVGDEVRDAFVAADPRAGAAFAPHGPSKWLADLYRLAHRRLAALGVTAVHGGGRCTFREHEHFYSHRRDRVTGRMAAIIWIAD